MVRFGEAGPQRNTRGLPDLDPGLPTPGAGRAATAPRADCALAGRTRARPRYLGQSRHSGRPGVRSPPGPWAARPVCSRAAAVSWAAWSWAIGSEGLAQRIQCCWVQVARRRGLRGSLIPCRLPAASQAGLVGEKHQPNPVPNLEFGQEPGDVGLPIFKLLEPIILKSFQKDITTALV